MRLLTPSFASPEQIRGERVSVASDVYSLGVVLYQLLTGSLPFQFASLDVLDIERVITGAEPVSPSVAVLRTGAEVARNRSTSPERLARALRGDLDTIVATALRKDPARRYASVEQFSDDIGRYLSGQPVRARRDTTLYVAGKFVRRHAAALAAVAVIILLLTSFAVVSALQSARIAISPLSRLMHRIGRFYHGHLLLFLPCSTHELVAGQAGVTGLEILDLTPYHSVRILTGGKECPTPRSRARDR